MKTMPNTILTLLGLEEIPIKAELSVVISSYLTSLYKSSSLYLLSIPPQYSHAAFLTFPVTSFLSDDSVTENIVNDPLILKGKSFDFDILIFSLRCSII